MTEELRRLRLAAGLSEARLARAVGVPVYTLRQWEAGKIQPRITTLARLAEALGVTLPVLQGRASQTPLERLQQQFRALFREALAASLGEPG
jgi:transcriptional regulator with XRE-family HTH domain